MQCGSIFLMDSENKQSWCHKKYIFTTTTHPWCVRALYFFSVSYTTVTPTERRKTFSAGVLGLFLGHGQIQFAIIVNMSTPCVRLLEMQKINCFN